ncbi:F0F1 ATP synthase subunit delta [Photobacterium damselae subsp. piscicida]|uniref:ATP synthase subunit delta n=1 Tax=Photobacterium damsela subsp. piscicida TaxID=38294 RepID=A0A1Q9GTJ7_PHODP|nr:F0F1 ATP synthase subunit delta [Photobacterium damselae]MBE8127952.1 F0F1 ATP synthase subunit delta [Photobacterium damselae subsp. piscicida]MDP2516412.1 F0F1 ATP synthase subunit delta [Photobacterium damselae subsp. piscicida]MDP2531768.1 F0F1 ATP synthase subunit delta [Photobacterium damselae subsp. piscicida]MDP2543495.1 F0F1 ATP synthase subunit delta [Photobacterium damselae subsp. piscicida]MDP2557181.1 F0F1 ATP synthase subunit delta [Photobacterium damselae subsp. piscicida]
MSELATIARPYAKAAFDFAVEKNTLAPWAEMLLFASEVAENDTMQDILHSGYAADKLSEIFVAVCGEQLDEHGQNLLKVMAENGRLKALPDVYHEFMLLKNELEKTVEAVVVSAIELNDAQRDAIEAKLSTRLERKVKLSCSVDETLIAGVVIRAGDLVIDNSVRGKLARLSDTLLS